MCMCCSFMPQCNLLPSHSLLGLCELLSLAMFAFSREPYSCVPLLSDSSTLCVSTLSRLLNTHWSVDICPLALAISSTHSRRSMSICVIAFTASALADASA